MNYIKSETFRAGQTLVDEVTPPFSMNTAWELLTADQQPFTQSSLGDLCSPGAHKLMYRHFIIAYWMLLFNKVAIELSNGIVLYSKG